MKTTGGQGRTFIDMLPVVSTGIGAVSLTLAVIALTRTTPLAQRVYHEDGRYLVKVRYGQWHDLQSFIQPLAPEVVAIYSEIGPDSWSLYNWVCQNIDYALDIAGEFWETPSETLARGQADCEGTAILLCSLLRNFTDAYVVIGDYQGYGHAWCQLNGKILETTYTWARSVPDSHLYQAFCLFNDQAVIELWPGALNEIFSLRRGRANKLRLIAEALL